MKPRLKEAPWTTEDFQILTAQWVGRGLRVPLFPLGHSVSADRRDADLMLQCAFYRQMGAYANVRQVQTMAGEDGCAVRGDIYSWVSPKWSDGRNIT